MFENLIRLNINNLYDLSFISSAGFHQLWLQVQVGRCKSIVICTVYRPPNSDLNCFDAEFSDALISALSLNHDVYVLGDLNCNLLNPQDHGSLAVMNFCSIFNLTQVIKQPTRTPFVSHKDKDCLTNILNAELNKLSIWFRANRLSLNLKKTKFIAFKPSQKRTNQTIQLLINNQKIYQVKETVFLRVIMDENLNWKSEISHVANKVSKCTGIIRKSSFYLSTKTLRTLYFSLVYPYLFYCNLVWAPTYRTNLIRLEILQKRVIRTIAKTTFDAHTDPIFQNLGILKFHDIYLIQLGLFMYSYQNHTLPLKFHCKFTLQSQIHSYNTRNSCKFRLPFCRTRTKQFSVFYQGPKFYNTLNTNIINASSPFSFKRALKAFICNNY